MYTDAKWVNFNNERQSIRVIINGMISFVPLNPANSDYQNIMKLVEEGKLVIQPAADNEEK